MKEEKDNILIFKEKPYYTDEELKLYYKIAIDEATKQGNEALANHYRILLDFVNNREKDGNSLGDFLLNHKNKK